MKFEASDIALILIPVILNYLFLYLIMTYAVKAGVSAALEEHERNRK
jgi:hypothetical protein